MILHTRGLEGAEEQRPASRACAVSVQPGWAWVPGGTVHTFSVLHGWRTRRNPRPGVACLTRPSWRRRHFQCVAAAGKVLPPDAGSAVVGRPGGQALAYHRNAPTSYMHPTLSQTAAGRSALRRGGNLVQQGQKRGALPPSCSHAVEPHCDAAASLAPMVLLTHLVQRTLACTWVGPLRAGGRVAPEDRDPPVLCRGSCGRCQRLGPGAGGPEQRIAPC